MRSGALPSRPQSLCQQRFGILGHFAGSAAALAQERVFAGWRGPGAALSSTMVSIHFWIWIFKSDGT